MIINKLLQLESFKKYLKTIIIDVMIQLNMMLLKELKKIEESLIVDICY